MKRLLGNPWLLLALRFILGGIFIYAGSIKLGDALSFADSIASFRVLPDPAVSILALALPPFEVLVGLLLVLGIQTRACALSLIILSIIFAVALGQALARGLEVDCGCFGGGKPSLYKTWLSLGRDILLLLVAIAVYRVATIVNPSSGKGDHGA